MVKTHLFVMVLLAVLSGSALATSGLTLELALKIALDNNVDLKAKEAAIDASRGASQKLSAFLPSSTRIGLQGAADFPFGNQGEYKVEAKISQEFEIAGQVFVRKKIGSLEVQKAEKDLEWSKDLLAFQIKSEFYHLFYLEKKKQIAQDLADSNRSLSQIAKKRQQQRVLTEFDSDLWNFEDADSFAGLMATTAELNEVRLRLKNLLGDETVDTEKIEGKWPSDLSLPALEEMLAYALANRADIARIHANIEQKANLYELARRSWVPNPALSFFFEQERSTSNGGNSNSFLGFGISVPLNLFIGKGGEVSKAAAEHRISIFEKTSLETEVTRDVRNYWQQLKLAAEIVARYGATESKYQSNVTLLQGAYHKGNVDLPTYLNYRDRLIKAQLRYAEAQWTRTRAFIGLNFVCGRIRGVAE